MPGKITTAVQHPERKFLLKDSALMYYHIYIYVWFIYIHTYTYVHVHRPHILCSWSTLAYIVCDYSMYVYTYTVNIIYIYTNIVNMNIVHRVLPFKGPCHIFPWIHSNGMPIGFLWHFPPQGRTHLESSRQNISTHEIGWVHVSCQDPVIVTHSCLWILRSK